MKKVAGKRVVCKIFIKSNQNQRIMRRGPAPMTDHNRPKDKITNYQPLEICTKCKIFSLALLNK